MKAYAVLVPVTYRNEPTRPNVLWCDVMAWSEAHAKVIAVQEIVKRDWNSELYLLCNPAGVLVWSKQELLARYKTLEYMEQQQCPTI